ncbi:hypothetical protein KFU94_12880 [Chloroflexi bacterium TSY]|nr:hypothetical protein [Chloroflexi bacterium TSY]MBV7328309.1 hypothetical protein [Chloroflexi bacterium TSY]MBV7329123.1 hypothetical protein [Chloroflexi bacterium TSY]
MKVVKRAHARHVVGLEAADEGVEGLIAHLPHPHIEARLTTEHHGQTRAQHGHRVAHGSSPVWHV